MVKWYDEILNRLEGEFDAGWLDSYEHKTIVCMCQRVLEKLADKYDNVKREVGDTMGGRVLEYPEKTIRREALAEGLQQGMKQGIQQGESERKRLKAENKALREENARLRALANTAFLK